jgi:hypothetical protein
VEDSSTDSSLIYSTSLTILCKKQSIKRNSCEYWRLSWTPLLFFFNGQSIKIIPIPRIKVTTALQAKCNRTHHKRMFKYDFSCIKSTTFEKFAPQKDEENVQLLFSHNIDKLSSQCETFHYSRLTHWILAASQKIVIWPGGRFLYICLIFNKVSAKIED